MSQIYLNNSFAPAAVVSGVVTIPSRSAPVGQ